MSQYDKDIYRWYKSHGICVKCHHEDAIIGVHCYECWTKRHEYDNNNQKSRIERAKKRRYDLVNQGLCPDCGNKNQNNGTIVCDMCRSKRRASAAKFRELHGIKKSAYLCKWCNEQPIPGKKFCIVHQEKMLAHMRYMAEKSLLIPPKQDHPWRKWRKHANEQP